MSCAGGEKALVRRGEGLLGLTADRHRSWAIFRVRFNLIEDSPCGDSRWHSTGLTGAEWTGWTASERHLCARVMGSVTDTRK